VASRERETAEPPVFCTFGILTTDIFLTASSVPAGGVTTRLLDSAHRPGGKAANMAGLLAEQGARSILVAAIGSNGLGPPLRDAAMTAGIDTRYLTMVPGETSGVCVIRNSPFDTSS
jgi:ribokinase